MKSGICRAARYIVHSGEYNDYNNSSNVLPKSAREKNSEQGLCKIINEEKRKMAEAVIYVFQKNMQKKHRISSRKK